MRAKIWMSLCSLVLLTGPAGTRGGEKAATTEPAANHPIMPVWPGIAPGSENWTQKEVDYVRNNKQMVRNVTHPTLTAYFPDPANANGTAIIIAPGGGFRFLSWQNEGTAVAEWLAERGVTAFVLKYRLLDTGASQDDFEKGKPATRPATSPAQEEISALASADGRQAMKVVRQGADQWKIDPRRIGFMGFSAGGAVTMGVVMQYDKDSRPDFAAPIYGAHAQGVIPDDAPPLFILCAADDKGAMPGSVKTFSDWRAAGHAAELHIYSKGGHGFGMSQRGLPVDHWIDRLGDWLEVQGLMKPGH
jgi:acetyl esterase/lipase